MEWFRKAASQNHIPAVFEIGMLYAEGKGVQKDLSEAAVWFRKAAEEGYAPAQRKLGFAYLYGQGLKRDLIESYKWLVLFEEQTGEPLDLQNPGWTPNMGSTALSVREQFKSFISRQQIARAERTVRQWIATHR
jgi:hypothetical protein